MAAEGIVSSAPFALEKTPSCTIGSTIPAPNGDLLTAGSVGRTRMGRDGPYTSTSTIPGWGGVEGGEKRVFVREKE